MVCLGRVPVSRPTSLRGGWREHSPLTLSYNLQYFDCKPYVLISAVEIVLNLMTCKCIKCIHTFCMHFVCMYTCMHACVAVMCVYKQFHFWKTVSFSQGMGKTENIDAQPGLIYSSSRFCRVVTQGCRNPRTIYFEVKIRCICWHV